MASKKIRRRKRQLRSVERLEERCVMSAEPLAPLSGSLDSAPDLVHHAERDADFWIDPVAEYDVDALMGDIEKSLSSAHGLTGLTGVRNNFGFTGLGQTVAIIDSGIAYNHFALGGGVGANYRVVGGWDFTENDWNPYDDGPEGSHGTHVAGIVGADTTGTTSDGVAPGVDLLGLRVFNDAGDGYFNWVESALQWVHANRNAFENPITTVNLSLGTSWNSTSVPGWSTLEDDFAQLKADGIFVTVSAGNSFTTTTPPPSGYYNTPGLSYPAASPHVVPVMSVDDTGSLSHFSQRHASAIAAPGRFIVSTVPDYAGNNNGAVDDWASFSGTSMAAPYVAGASVLLRQAMQFVGYATINQDVIFNHMLSTADTFFDAATNQNYKRLNLTNAFNALMPADEYGSTAGAAHNLGTLSGASTVYGLIGTLTDADYFTFTAGSTGAVSFTINTSPGLAPIWTGAGAVSGASNQTYTFSAIAGQTYTFGLSTSGSIGYYTMNVSAAGSTVNHDPVLSAIGNRTVNEGSTISFTASAVDADPGQQLTYGLHGGPAGATVNWQTGAFSWTPTESQSGVHTMTIWVMDNQTPVGDDWETFTITVNEVNVAPVLAAISNKSVVEGNLLTFTATATDADLPANTLTFSLDGGGPAGASIHPTTGVFTWTPTAQQGPGTYNITARATDAGGLSNAKTFTVTVLDGAQANQAPVLAAIGNRTVSQGSLLSFTVTATDPNVGQHLTYGLHGAPAGAWIDHQTGAFRWTPSASQAPGTYTMTIWVMDNQTPHMDDWETFQVTVTQPAQNVRYLSTTASGGVIGCDNVQVNFTDADIVKLMVEYNGWYRYAMEFDGSDVGLELSSEGIDAFTYLPDGSILVSTVGSFWVSTSYSAPGFGSGAVIAGSGEDLLRFTPSMLGNNTAGTWSLYFDGSDAGLSGVKENIDSVSVLSDGRILISTTGNSAVPGVSAADEDILAFSPTALGDSTWGYWSFYFDGSDVGLSTVEENIDALAVAESGANPTLYLSTKGNFAVPGMGGTNDDIFAFTPTQLGGVTGGYFASQHVLTGAYIGLGFYDIDGIYIGGAPSPNSLATRSHASDVNAPLAVEFEVSVIAANSGLQRRPMHTRAASDFKIVDEPRQLTMASIDSVFQSLSAALTTANDEQQLDEHFKMPLAQERESDEATADLVDNIFQNVGHDAWRSFPG